MYSCLSGGLGNQMFQYAAAYILKQYRPEVELVLDDSYYHYQPKIDTPRNLELNQFNIVYDRFTSVEEKKKINSLRNFKKIPLPANISNFIALSLFNKYVLSDDLLYYPQLANKLEKACLFSFYQDSTLLNKYRELILPLFDIRDDLLLLCKNLNVYKLIVGQDNITALHIRRGDYVTNSHAAKFHGTLSMDYYNKAMDYIEQKKSKQLFVVFSDDVQWALETFSNRENCYVVNNQECEFSVIDMYLMSLCNNIIIANSTYSWWGAWLNKSEDQVVIAPQQWFANNNKTTLKNEDWVYI
ncbi:alpha-1,2-fucosyltransferase [Xenorhabdus sp. 12]|uniref:Alpha-1,2-fucosyltransferase n=1 Tax=Xenorhabdus santafensis TaxID=2582833 RepID=A0ABU4S5C3_9GAMM|nr:alpha-1,2-fucosyltransferase [Xenorhabdus sp. 12]MDX7986410.1 alpha-1,2-fucosyltransferase [Xenorhabdus sp. 12]